METVTANNTATNMAVPPDSAPMAMVLPPSYDFAPKDLGEAMKLAEMLASSTMVPKDFMQKPGNCFIAMQWGTELGLKPLQALQNIAVINGKPGLYGDAGKALLMHNGYKIDEDDTRVIEANKFATCTITRPDGSKVTRTFSQADAKTAGLWEKSGPWTTYPWRQMAWRAFWFAARDAAANVLKGLPGAEELRDIPPPKEKDVTAQSTVVEDPKPQTKSAKTLEKLKKVTVEEVVKHFNAAVDSESIKAGVAMATKLTEDSDKDQASKAYHAAVERFRKAQAPIAPTIEEVRQKLAAATNVDECDLAGSLIAGLEAEADIKEALQADYKAIKEKFVAKE